MPTIPFTREMVMDVTLCRETHRFLTNQIGTFTTELDSVNTLLNSGMRSSWQGYSAAEYFSLYDAVSSEIKQQIVLLEILTRKFGTNIQAWEEMAAILAA